MIDLHSHTTASDGEHAPEALLALAAKAGVKVLAVTDHDTVAGLASAQEAARLLGVAFVPGIEVSAFVGRKEVHLLGHFIDSAHAALLQVTERLRGERSGRMEAMIARAQALGFPLHMEQVRAIAGDAQLGRPHLARLLVERGYCTSLQDAFDRYLGEGRPMTVEREKLQGADAIRLIREAGGTATLAHPQSSRVELPELQQLAAAGLSGLEVFHMDHHPSVREKWSKLARQLDLVPTAGSDFHGAKVSPGRTPGCASMPRANLAALIARAPRPQWHPAGLSL
ncbi:PHP domain-containing protein [Aggregicoccus sp. 17bor-14]|uniref:PHP domain-containing protein n=1 Tax=Myxococcaceae TaxID=31 RepID=UPI00129CFECC|nr:MULTISPECIES: PHP domain-containing protein [Myxococcaceae]MBF5041353.1 PHP domain-containing protein [Simulacricoccus sp. 17bor-14]MRI87139.1 PHP domain-containing protein [Aggregicoccus sp. 17bor-14]